MPLMTQREKDELYQPIQDVLDRMNNRILRLESKLAEASKPAKKATVTKEIKKAK